MKTVTTPSGDVFRTSLSTRQMSKMLGVHESSVKRWCNNGELGYWLTSGGHRRIPFDEAIRFAEEKNIKTELAAFGCYAERVWDGVREARSTGSFANLAGLIGEWLPDGKPQFARKLIQYLTSDGFSLGLVFDGLVAPSMRTMGNAYHRGEMRIGDEHRFTHMMRDTLILLEPDHSGESVRRSKTAIVGCMREEFHELGALMARSILTAGGWNVVYLGADVPTEEFAAQQRTHEARLVCISLFPPRGLPDAKPVVELLDVLCSTTGIVDVAIGGARLSETEAPAFNTDNIRDVRAFGSMQAFEGWLEAISTGG